MIVGVNGTKGAGKDTLGAYLVDNYGFERLSFAAALKESAAHLFGLPIEFWENWKNEPKAVITVEVPHDDPEDEFFTSIETVTQITVREFLQRYGTESHRDVFGDNFWVDFLLSKADPDKDYVITDARFENELKAIQDLGGTTIRVERHTESSTDTHASEAYPSMELLDWILDNNFDLPHLYAGADAIMEELGVERSSTPTAV